MASRTTKARNTRKAASAKNPASRKAARSTRKAAARRAPKGAGGYADVNGLHMYYEIYGKGQPLVLLHGAFSAIGSSFGKMLPGLAAGGRQVIGLEMQAHGR